LLVDHPTDAREVTGGWRLALFRAAQADGVFPSLRVDVSPRGYGGLR
jgi:hypothetical protein